MAVVLGVTTSARAQDTLFMVLPTYTSLAMPTGAQYTQTFANKALGSLMTKAVMPTFTHQDAHYYRQGEGGVFHRLAYAASRSVVTRAASGSLTLNLSEVAGTGAAAGQIGRAHV